jgi:hypothetical protein
MGRNKKQDEQEAPEVKPLDSPRGHNTCPLCRAEYQHGGENCGKHGSDAVEPEETE